MLYKVSLLALVAQAAAQSCGTTGAGTDACKCYLTPCADISSFGTPITTTTNFGPVTGRSGTDGIDRYVGIPIAATTAGNNRWKPPQNPATWTTAYAATLESMCPQWGYPIFGTENCVSVDVMTVTGGSGLAVGFWIHGGGFTNENPFFGLFINLRANLGQSNSFAHLPNNGRTMSVLLHYRLGALGWMSHPGFVDSTVTFPNFPGSNPGAGNYGTMDALSGLQWVQSNAAAFGGDATKVTVYGESAGAAHIAVLGSSPLTQGLVSTFIAESPFISFEPATFSMTARQEMDILFTLRTGCTSVAVLSSGTTATTEAACLRSASIALLIPDAGFGGSAGGGPPQGDTAVSTFDAAYGSGASSLFLYNSVHVWPCVDGFVWPQAPLQLYASGINSGVTFVFGHNADEYSTFCYSPPWGGSWICAPFPDIWNIAWQQGLYYLPVTASLSQIVTAVTAQLTGTKLSQVTAGLYYSDIIDTVEQYAIQMGTDAWFAKGTNMAINAVTQQTGRVSGTVYYYVFAQDTDPDLPKMGACHGCELTYVLGFYGVSATYLKSQAPASFGLLPYTVTSDSTLVGVAMNSYWASIFYNASPNAVGSGLPTWTPMYVNDKNTMTFNGGFPLGALMNPCVRFATCRTEPTKNWRYAQKTFWETSPATPSLPTPTCTSAAVGQLSHTGGAAATPTPLVCTFLPCCTYGGSGRRSLLFGMPTTGSTSCDPVC